MTASPPQAVEEDSLWLSRYERAMMEAETGGFPPYLKQLAKEALAAETAWRARLSTEAPETLAHLLALKAWLADPDKGASNFPGWDTPGWWSLSRPLSRNQDLKVVVAAPGGEALAIKDGRLPVDLVFQELSALDPSAYFDDDKSDRMLGGSLKLSVAEKKREFNKLSIFMRYFVEAQAMELRSGMTKILQTESLIIEGNDRLCRSGLPVSRPLSSLDRRRKAPSAKTTVSQYWAFESALLACEVDRAAEAAEENFDPGRFLTYEPWLKARKAQGVVAPEWLAELVAKAGAAGGPGLAQAVQLLIDLEQAESIGPDTLRWRLTDFNPDPGLAWTRPYLLGRFRAFFDPDPDAFLSVLGHLGCAIGLLPDDLDEEREILTKHVRRAQLLVGSGPAMIARPGRLWALERFWCEAGWLLQSEASGYGSDGANRKIELAAIIRSNAERFGLAADLGLSSALEAPTDEGRVLEEHLNALGQALGELGFDSDGADGRAFARAMAEDRLDEAEALLVAAEARVATGIGAMRWESGRADLWRRRGRLGAEIDRLRASYQTLPSARNGWALVAALKAAGPDRRAETLAVAETLARRFWYLPVFQTLLYRVHHDFFTRQPDPPAARQALLRGLALGPTWSLFDDIAEFERWRQATTTEPVDKETAALHAMIAGLADGMYLGGNYHASIIAAFTLGWDEIGLALFLLASRARPYDADAYCCLAIGNDNNASRTPVVLAANARALNLAAEATVVPFSNSAGDFRGLARADSSGEAGWSWCLYRAVLAVWLSPQHTWTQYSCLLAAAARLERPALFLAAWCVGRDHGAPEIESRFREALHTLLAGMVREGALRPAEPIAGAWLAFLARVVAEEADWLVAQHGVLAPGHQVFDLLRRLELAAEPEDGSDGAGAFLAREAARCRRELMLRDDWLLLRWPEETGTDRHARRVRELGDLAAEFPDPRYRVPLERMVDDWQRRPLYRALSGGRIAHSHARTLQAVATDVGRTLDRFAELRLACHRWEEDITERGKTLADETVLGLVRTWGRPISALATDACNALIGDWLFALRRRDIAAAPAGDDTGATGAVEAGVSPDADAGLAALTDTVLRLGRDYGVLTENDAAAVTDALRPLVREWTRGAEERRALSQQTEEEHRKHWHEVFRRVLAGHALAGSELFESFRTRIRHGWLIASLSDCFARFDLYHDGPTDAVLTPTLAEALAGLDGDRLAGLEARLRALRAEFRQLVSRLDHDWLWLKDDSHPEALLDFGIETFALAPLVDRLPLLATPAETLIEALCGEIDTRAQACFAGVRTFLHQHVYRPLERHLAGLEAWLEEARAEVRALPNGVHLFGRLKGQLQDARGEFAARIGDYQSWFAFQEQGVRDVTLPEIAQLAWSVVAEVDAVRIRNQAVQSPAWITEGREIVGRTLAGGCFSDLLEVFKIVFQNIIYHARPAAAQPESLAGPGAVPPPSRPRPSPPPCGPGAGGTEPEIQVGVHFSCDGEGRLCCQIASTCVAPERLDVAGLRAMLDEPTLRRTRAGGKRGSGLATVREILRHRLEGAEGDLSGPQLLTGSSRALAAPPPGAALFVVELALTVTGPARPPEPPPPQVPTVDPDAEVRALAGYAVRVLVVEDQDPKFNALAAFLRTLLPGCGIARTADLESTARLLTAVDAGFDLLVLDMTLPVDPLPDAALKSLAGLDVLKILTAHERPVPTVLVTQYSNWSSEAIRNTRQFMDELSAACGRDYPTCFRGAVRFSHVDLAWQPALRDVVAEVFGTTARVSAPASPTAAADRAAAVRARLAANPDDREALAWRAAAQLDAGRCHEALADYRHLAGLDPQAPEVQAGLARAYAGLGLAAEAERAVETYCRLSGADDGADRGQKLREQMLRGEMEQLRRRLQGQRQSEMMTTLGQIAGGMAHELFTPMAIIQLQIDQARRYVLPALAPGGTGGAGGAGGTVDRATGPAVGQAAAFEELNEVFAEIERQKQRMAMLVEHLRTLASGDHVATQAVDLGAVVRAALTLQTRQLEAHGITPAVEIAKTLPTVNGNPLMLEQVVINLLLNAHDALKQVAAGPRRLAIVVGTKVYDGREWVELRVTDNGPGVDPSIRARIFDPFFTTKSVGAGLGLGLSLARETVRECGGTLTLDSPPGGGAGFVITLPTTDAAPPATLSSPPKDPPKDPPTEESCQ